LPDDKISFEFQNPLDVFSKTVFKDPHYVLRELLTNAQDACIIRKVEDPEFASPLIIVSAEERERLLHVKDNGRGMTDVELREYFATSERVLPNDGSLGGTLNS
jgi:HSP90 family molecular chaperone